MPMSNIPRERGHGHNNVLGAPPVAAMMGTFFQQPMHVSASPLRPVAVPGVQMVHDSDFTNVDSDLTTGTDGHKTEGRLPGYTGFQAGQQHLFAETYGNTSSVCCGSCES
jgi:hypothetical protein